ncbi:hypothetical protein Trydic_g14254 [Trypoxylus dichotomus]
MKDVAQFHQLTVLNELSSDHNSVLLQLGQTAPEDEELWTRQTVSWPAFADHLFAHIGPITAIGGPIELETAVRQVTERVSDSVRYINQHLACRRRQILHPQGSPRPDTGEEPAPKTVAENVKPG